MSETATETLGQRCWRLMRVLAPSRTERLLEAIRAERLTTQELRVLEACRRGARPVKACAALSGLSRTGASRAVASLARRGLVDCERGGQDGRCKLVGTSERGMRALERIERAELELLELRVAALEPEQAAALERLCELALPPAE